jgi:hypothetical protein
MTHVKGIHHRDRHRRPPLRLALDLLRDPRESRTDPPSSDVLRFTRTGREGNDLDRALVKEKRNGLLLVRNRSGSHSTYFCDEDAPRLVPLHESAPPAVRPVYREGVPLRYAGSRGE